MSNLQDFRWHKFMCVLIAMLLCVWAATTTVTSRIDSLGDKVSNIEGHIVTLKEDVASIDAHLDRMEQTAERIETTIDALVERSRND